MSRISCPVLAAKVVAAEEAVAHIDDGDNVGFSGFTGAGYPKAVPAALAATMIRAHDEGRQFQVGLWTGASTAPDADGVLAAAYGISTRLPYNSDPTLRGMINTGDVRYIDAHLSHSAQHMWFGFYGKLDVAVVEVTAALGDGLLVPSTSVGNNKTWLDQAERVILEVNHWQPRELEGFHDIYYGTALPPSRRPIMLTEAMQRIGEPYLHVDRAKVVAVVETHSPDRNAPFSRPTTRHRRSPATWSTSYATRSVPDGCRRGCCRCSPASATSPMRCWPDSTAASSPTWSRSPRCIQDGMLDLLDCGTLRAASATSFGLSAMACAGSWPTSTRTRAASCCAARRSPTTRSSCAGSA